jgi:hypothetical protein
VSSLAIRPCADPTEVPEPESLDLRKWPQADVSLRGYTGPATPAAFVPSDAATPAPSAPVRWTPVGLRIRRPRIMGVR